MLAIASCNLLTVTGASADIHIFSIGLLPAALALLVGLENYHDTM